MNVISHIWMLKLGFAMYAPGCASGAPWTYIMFGQSLQACTFCRRACAL